jgi:S-DNA-T family DNA segregation ATPase FtsK/SpoIIIE
VKEIEPADEVIVISPREFGAASTADILGGASDASSKPEEKKSDDDTKNESLPDAEKKPSDAQVNITGITPTRPKQKSKKPITVASTPIIGNYQLPSIDFLQLPDMTAKPTESREELLANARLMQQTLAQFDIPVELGDITKGPTITRYELHPAPGVKLEKISALSNNIAAALKAERINILAPVPGKAPWASRYPTRSRPRSSCATCSSPMSGATRRPGFLSRWARMFTGIRSLPISRRCRTA